MANCCSANVSFGWLLQMCLNHVPFNSDVVSLLRDLQVSSVFLNLFARRTPKVMNGLHRPILIDLNGFDLNGFDLNGLLIHLYDIYGPPRPGLGNLRPAGHMRPAEHFYVAHELRLKFS